MRKDTNQVFLTGNLGNDPVSKETKNGVPFAKFSLATNDFYTDNNGVKKQITDWHSIIIWGKRSNNLVKYLSSGSKVLVMGKLKNNNWNDDNNVKHYGYNVVVNSIQFLDSNKKEIIIDDSDIPF